MLVLIILTILKLLLSIQTIDVHDVYKNIDEYNPDKENEILIVFDDMIADMIHSKKQFNNYQIVY